MDELITAFRKYQPISGTLQNAIYHALKEAILNQRLPPEITESQVSLSLNVSRTPVREAMHKLSAEGLLEISHGRKARVKCITERDIADISIVLKGLHMISITLCVARATDNELNQLKELLDLMEYYTGRQDIDQIARYNTLFHLKICEFGKNKWLYDIIENLLNYSLVFRSRVVSRAGRAEHALEEHRQIYRLLLQRDEEGLKSMIETHVNTAFEQ